MQYFPILVTDSIFELMLSSDKIQSNKSIKLSLEHQYTTKISMCVFLLVNGSRAAS